MGARKDFSQVAYAIVQQAVGEIPKQPPPKQKTKISSREGDSTIITRQGTSALNKKAVDKNFS